MGTETESLVIKAAIRDELSAPIAGIRTELAGLKAEVAGVGTKLDQAGKQTDRYGAGLGRLKDRSAGLTTVMRGVRDVGAGMLLGFAGGVAVIARFESAMSELHVASGATVTQMKDLRSAAIEAGKSGIFTETQAAQGMTALAKAGVSVTDILHGGLTGALDLAAAGGQDLSAASETMASTLAQFNLQGSQATHVADLLAAGAGKAQGSVADLAESLKYAGLVAHNTGVPVEQTVGALAMFAQKGLIGSQAGTTFQEMLLKMNPAMGASRDLVHKLGIEAYDSQGRFIGLANYAQLLKTRLGGMSAEQRQATLSQIFGQRAIQGATILYEAGAKGVKDWTAAVNDSGYASQYASGRLDNLSGDALKLKGTLQALVTGSGSSTNSMLRTMTQHLTNDLELFSRLPGGLQSTGLALTGVAGAGLTLVGTLGTVLPKFDHLQESLGKGGKFSQALGSSVGFAKGAFLAAIPIIGIAAAAVDYFGQKAAARRKDVTSLADAMAEDGNAIGVATRKLEAGNLVHSKAIDMAGKLGISASDVTTAVLGQGKALDDLHSHLNAVIDAGTTLRYQAGKYSSAPVKVFNDQAQAAINLKGALDDQVGKLRDAQKQNQEMAAALDATSSVNVKVQNATGQSTTAFYNQELAMQDATDSASALKNMLDGLNGVNLTLAQNQVSFHQSLLAIKDTIDSNVKSREAHAKALDLDTAAGLSNNANLNSAVQQANQLAQAVTNQTGSVDLGVKKFGEYIGAIRKAAIDSGLSGKAVDALLSQIAVLPTLAPKVPVHANTKPALAEAAAARSLIDSDRASLPVHANTGPAQAAVNTFMSHVGELHASIGLDAIINTIIHPTPGAGVNPKLNSAGVPNLPTLGGPGKAFGGPVTGPGSARSDSVLTPLSNREWIMPWDAREHYGDAMMTAIQNRSLPKWPAAAQPDTGAGHRLAGGIFFAAGAVTVKVANASPAELERADLPGLIAAAAARVERDRAERS